MKDSPARLLAHLLAAAVLFALSFGAVRAWIGRSPAVGREGSTEITTIAGGSPAVNQSLLPGGNRPSLSAAIADSPGVREFFERWRIARDGEDTAAIHALIAEWVHAGPEAGIALALAQDEPGLAWALAVRWAEIDDHAALAAARAIPLRSTADVEGRDRLRFLVARKRFREHPEEFAALFAEFPMGLRSYTGNVREEEIGDLDPARQAAALEEISESAIRRSFAGPLLSKWARTDPEAARQWLEDHLPDRDGRLFAKVLRGWASIDPRAAADQIPEGGDTQRRRWAIGEFLAGAVESDPDFALEWATENFDETVQSALKQSAFGSAGVSGKLVELGQELTSRGLSEPLVTLGNVSSFVAQEWPPRTEEAVQRWAGKGFYGGSKASPRTWKLEDVQAATAFLVENPELAKSGDWHRKLSEKWAKENPRAALEWSASLPSELQIEAAESALEAWFRIEPARAVAFTESLPASEFRGYAIEKIAGEWVRAEPDAAIAWAAKLPAGAARNAAAGRLSRHLRYRQPRRAAEVARSIDDDVLRLDSLSAVIDIWARFHRKEAETFVSEAGFPDQERQSLLDRIARR